MEREENGEEGKRGEKIQGQILKSESYSQTNFSLCLLSCFHSRLTGTDKSEQLAEQNDRKMEG